MPEEPPRQPRTAGGSDRPDWPAVESAVRQLAVNYALGTDAFGRDDAEAGLALYRRTFTPDADISIAGNADTRRTGPEEWAAFVEGTFRGAGHVRTQHLVGTVNVIPGADAAHAEMSTYMHASHLNPSGEVYVVLLTYVDEAVRTADGWRIARRTLHPMASWTQRPDAADPGG